MGISLEVAKCLEKSRELLVSEFTRPITLAEAADEAFLSAFHYQRLFKMMYKESPLSLITRRRMERAKELLLRSDLTVSEICLEIGYSGIGTFSSSFKKMNGCTPSEFREGSRRYFELGRLWSHKLIPHCFVLHPR